MNFFPIHRAWLIAGTSQMFLFLFPLRSVPGARGGGWGFHDDLLLNDLFLDLVLDAQVGPSRGPES